MSTHEVRDAAGNVLSRSGPEGAFAKALAAFQESLPHVDKSQDVDSGRFTYSFAPLDKLVHQILPLLAKNGIAYTACPALADGQFVLRCALVHAEGWREEGAYLLPDPRSSTPQQIGSAITYARRYALLALTGVAPSDEDDDAQAAQHTRPAPVRASVQFDDDPSFPPSSAPASASGAAGSIGELRNRILKAAGQADVNVMSDFRERYGVGFSAGTQAQLDEYLSMLTKGVPA